MSRINLKSAEVIGWYSLPSQMLLECNPEAYYSEWKQAPEGAGTCQHCGMAIVHHVIIRDENLKVYLVGTKCAEAVGADGRAIRSRKTTQQIAEQDAKWKAMRTERERLEAANEAQFEITRAARYEHFKETIDMLRAIGSEFHASLAEQLTMRPLSFKQQHYVMKAWSPSGRRNQVNAEAWDKLSNDLMTFGRYFVTPDSIANRYSK